jgi:putative ABC transport system permease protein
MNFLNLVRLMIVRNLRRDWFLTVLSIIGVALGIGLFIGVKVASDRAVSSFEVEIRGLDPVMNYEIVDISGIDFSERIYSAVLERVDNSLPVLRVNGHLPALHETVTIEGIYTVRLMSMLRSASSARAHDLEGFLREPDGVMVTKQLADTHSLKKGGKMTVMAYDREYSLSIVDLIDDPSLPGRLVLMDIGNFQEHFGKTGHLSRIDLEADAETAGAVGEALPSHLAVVSKEQSLQNQKALLKSFRYNLQFVSLIAILVGLFLLYNTVFLSVIKRRTEIGILRGLGVHRKTVVLLFLTHGLLLGAIGSVVGIVFGQAAAFFSVFAVEKTISTIYSPIAISGSLITIRDVSLAFGLGIAVSLGASALPAYEASKVKPSETAREGSFEGRYLQYVRRLAAAGLASIACGVTACWYDYQSMPFDFPFLAYAGILFIIAGFAFASPFFFTTVLRLLRRISGRSFGAAGQIAISDMQGNIYRFSVALMSVAISGALIIALLTLIFSFRGSLRSWIRQNIHADVYVKPSSCSSNFCFFPLSPELVGIVSGFPEVAAVDRFRTLNIDFFGKKIIAGFGDLKVQGRFGEGHPELSSAAAGQEKSIGISSYLGFRYNVKRGDTIDIRTPKGLEQFVVRDVFSSYSTTSGFVYLDRKWLKEFWGLDDATQIALYLREGIDINGFISRMQEAVRGRFAVDIMNNDELRQKVLAIFDKTFAITYAIEAISIAVSLIGVINTLLTFVLERKREISVLRYLGGSWQQITRVLVLSAGMIGICGIILGSVMGLVMSVIFITVINKISFGWEIQFSIPYLYLSGVTAVLFLTTLMAGVIPARVARRVDPKRFISFE